MNRKQLTAAALADNERKTIDLSLSRGRLMAAMRVFLGGLETTAARLDAVRAVDMMQHKPNGLTLSDNRKMRTAWVALLEHLRDGIKAEIDFSKARTPDAD